MLWITAALVLPFGALTIYFHDQSFIQMKPTIVYTMFAVILGYGLIAKKPLLQLLLETAYPGLSAKGWRLLTINWTGFFVAMAVLNEAMRHALNWDQWVTFKTWAVIPMTLVFAMLNIPMLLKHGLQLDKPEDTPLPPEG
jgi:intracellular septation protein